MNIKPPTFSQAAVVLKNFSKEIGLPFKLAQAQEAIARMHGYADWNTLTAHVGARTSVNYTAEPPTRDAVFKQWTVSADERYFQVEWDPEFYGGNYDQVGKFAYVPNSLAALMASSGVAGDCREQAFAAYSGIDPVHIVHVDSEQEYDKEGEELAPA